MKNSHARLLAISGATLALVVATTAAVSAHPGDRGNQRGGASGQGKAQAGADFQRGEAFGGLRDGLGLRGGPGLHGGLGGPADAFVRTESIVDLGEDGIQTRRVDNGTVSSASDSSIDYSLATGDSATATIDEDTQVYALSESEMNVGRRGFRGPRMVPTEITPTDIEAGAEVVIWAHSQDDGSFLAQRIVVQPMIAEAADEAADAPTDTAAAATTDA